MGDRRQHRQFNTAAACAYDPGCGIDRIYNVNVADTRRARYNPNSRPTPIAVNQQLVYARDGMLRVTDERFSSTALCTAEFRNRCC